MTFFYILIIAILLFIGYQLWKSNVISTQASKFQAQKDFDEVLKQKFPHIFLDYKDELRKYWNRLKRAEKSLNEEDRGMHWSFIHMAITDKYQLGSSEYLELERLRLETGKFIKKIKEKFTNDEVNFSAWKLWNELAEFDDVKGITKEFPNIAEKYFI